MLSWLSSPAKMVFLGLFLVVLYMVWPFIPYIIMGAVLSVLSYPLLRKIRGLGVGHLTAAILTTLLSSVVLFLPIFFLLFVGTRTAANQLPFLVSRLSPQFFQKLMMRPELVKVDTFLRKGLKIDADRMREYTFDLTQNLGEYLARGFASIVTHIPTLALSLTVMIMSLLYFLHMGPKLRAFVDKRNPLPKDTMQHLENKFVAISNALVLAALIIAVLQSATFSLVCLALGMDNVSAIGLVVFLMSFIPLIGSAPFTFGLAAYQFATANTTEGTILLVAALVAASLDNLVRPMLLRQSASINPLVGILAILGGVRVFGFAGIFLGPLLVGLLQESLQVFDDKPLS